MKTIGLILFATALMAGDDVPAWVREAATQQTATYPAKVAMVTLLDDETLTIQADGRQVTHERVAVKMLQHTRHVPSAECYYNPKSGKVREFQAWLLPPTGKPTTFGKNAIVDQSLSTSYEYDEERVKVIEPGSDLAPGTVFAWEILDEEKTAFPADEHGFQGEDPVLVSRYTLALPAGWVASATLFNHDALAPEVSGTTYTWELRNLPWIEPEAHSPAIHTLAPRLGVNYYPEDPATPSARPVKNWHDMSVWATALYDPPSVVTEAIRAKAAELTAGAATELDRIRAIAAFVQKINYVAVEINIARGGGYQPHAADQVLARHYGDCKDKATLMRALLKAAGIESYPVIIYATDRQFVHPEWPSPNQFNHAIIAVRITPETKLPSVIEQPKLGRLLIFDSTDPVTPVGNLPEDEQASYALVVAGVDGDLAVMPMLPAKLNRIESAAEGQLKPDGSLAAQMRRQYFGQSASHLRYISMFGQHDELKRIFEAALSERLGGLSLDRIEPADRMADDQFGLNMDVTVKQFGHLLQGRLLMVAPGELARGTSYRFPAKPRTAPVRLNAELFQDSVTIAVPPQFKVDELPDPVKVTGAYGSFSAQWKAEGDKVRFEQSLEVKELVAPAADYSKIRGFFDQVEAARNSSVVLVKQ
jgi:transglutaminase-like putative cysteine protease